MTASAPPLAQVVLLTGPSGSGKSRLAQRSGLPVVRLDDFYRSDSEPDLPLLPGGQIDWDDPRTWNADAALESLLALTTAGSTTVPIYDIATNGPSGSMTVELNGAKAVVAEGIFASELIADCARHGILAAAVCVRRPRWLTFALRLTRDLREHRKSPMFLVRRGIVLARTESSIVARLLAAGCTLRSVKETERLLSSLR